MKHAVDFALLGAMHSVSWDASGEMWEQTYEDLPERIKFLRSLKDGDVLYLEMGGLAEDAALGAYRRGVRVLRIPPVLLKKHEKEMAGNGDEKSARHHTIRAVAEKSPELFYELVPADTGVIEVSILARDWQGTMRDRIRAGNRRYRRFYRRVILNPAQFADLTKAELKKKAQEWVESDAGWKAIASEEEECKAELASAVKRLSLYKEVFEPIEGVGPGVAARFIMAIGRMDRFPSEGSFRAYCGYGLKDGVRQDKKSGETISYSPKAKNAVGQFMTWLMRYGKNTEYGKMLAERLAFEQGAHPEWTERRQRGRARTWVAWRFLRRIYKTWRAFERPLAAAVPVYGSLVKEGAV